MMLRLLFLGCLPLLTIVCGKTELRDTDSIIQVIMREQASMIKHCMNNVCTRNMYNPNKRVRLSEKKRVAFTASPQNHLRNIAANAKIVIGKIYTNIGNAYNGSTGVFIAPLDGIYVFHWTIMTLHGKYTVVHIQVNGSNKVLAYGNAKNYPNWYSPSQSYVTELKKGNKVNLALDPNGGGYVHPFSTFTGYRV